MRQVLVIILFVHIAVVLYSIHVLLYTLVYTIVYNSVLYTIVKQDKIVPLLLSSGLVVATLPVKQVV